MDGFSKVTKAIPVKRTTAAHVAGTFLDALKLLYRILDRALTDNGPQCAANFLNGTCVALSA